jgi:hypothetical protein
MGAGWAGRMGQGRGGKLIPFFSFFSYSISIISVCHHVKIID